MNNWLNVVFVPGLCCLSLVLGPSIDGCWGAVGGIVSRFCSSHPLTDTSCQFFVVMFLLAIRCSAYL
jgi:hypothetical protein